MKCSINKKYYFLLLILFFAGGLPAKSFNLDKTKPEDIIRLASYNIRTKGDKGDKAWEVRLNALVDVVRRNKFDMFAKSTEAKKGNRKHIGDKRCKNTKSGNKIYHGNQSFTNL